MTDTQPIRILYMEDDPDIAQLLKNRLEQHGYQVDLAPDGQKGLSMYQQGEYNLIAVDQHMPHMDGLDVLRTLATRGPLPPAIMVTGTGNEQVAVEALKLGASDYIVKDVTGSYLELLPTVIEQVLHQQQLLQEKQQALAALEQRNQDLALLNQAGQTFTATLDLQQLTRLLLRTATQLVGAQGSSVWLWDEAQPGWLVCQVVFNQGEHSSPLNLRLRPGEGIAGWVAQNAQSVIVPDTSQDNRFSTQIDAQTGFRTTSLVSVPLQGRDGIIGVLEVVNKCNGTFTENDLTLIEALAAPAAIALDNARMVEALRQHALELQERNQELDSFAHTVAHDLRSPLVSIMGYADMLNTFLDTMPKEEIREDVEAILRIGRKMDNIIEELLLLAGVRRSTVEVEPLLMSAIVNEARQRLADLIEEAGAELVIPTRWPVALGYGPWVEEVWVNYLSNALKYGGHPPYIEMGAEAQEDGMIRFWMKDNGPGLSEEEQSKLFVPFTRLSQIRAQGHGLGLSIVQRIIDKLGGQVGVESEPGQGSLFYFTLPAAEEL
ncbi:MAG: response regulator [Caldilineae bacterium]|nr:MAG: response regulator [Caldilineae bacterium]